MFTKKETYVNAVKDNKDNVILVKLEAQMDDNKTVKDVLRQKVDEGGNKRQQKKTRGGGMILEKSSVNSVKVKMFKIPSMQN